MDKLTEGITYWLHILLCASPALFIIFAVAYLKISSKVAFFVLLIITIIVCTFLVFEGYNLTVMLFLLTIAATFIAVLVGTIGKRKDELKKGKKEESDIAQ